MVAFLQDLPTLVGLGGGRDWQITYVTEGAKRSAEVQRIYVLSMEEGEIPRSLG